MTACGGIPFEYLGTSRMSLLTNMFSPIEMPMALLVISTDLAESYFLSYPPANVAKVAIAAEYHMSIQYL